MKFIFLLLISVVLFATSFAQTKTYKNEIGFQSDNDGFLGQGSDRYYTAGNFLYFRHALKINAADSSLKNKVLGFELGQKIYNPQTGAITSFIFVDRPFAAYLYAGSTLNFLYKNESNLKLEAQIGMVGPDAYGEQIQDLIHNTFGFYHPSGWQYQIQDAFQLNLSAEYNRLLTRGKSVDLSLSSYAALGTGQTGAGAGFLLRIGAFNQLFNSVSTGSTVSANGNIKPINNGELFFYLKPMFNVRAYDATVQGGLFDKKDDPNEITSTLNPLLGTLQVGGQLAMGRWVADASATYDTREDKEMVLKHNGHQWGSLTLLYRF
jgi:hypothetical protein